MPNERPMVANRRLLSALLCCSAAFLCAGGARAQAPQLYVESGIRHSARAVTLSPDGQFAATGSLDRTIKVWGLKESRELLTLANDKASYVLAFHPTLPLLVSSNEDGTLTVWDFRKRQLVATLECRSRIGRPPLAFPTPGTSLICVDDMRGVIKRWELPQFTETTPNPIPADPRSEALGLSRDGSVLAARDEKGFIRLLSTKDWQERCKLESLPYEVDSVAFAPRSGRLLSMREATDGIRLWDGASCLEIKEGRGSPAFKQRGVHSAAFSRDESLVALATEEGDVVLLDGATWLEQTRLKSYANRVETAGVLADPAALAVQLWYDTVIKWDVGKGAPGVPAKKQGAEGERWETEGEIFGQRVVVENRQDSVRLLRDDRSEICTVVFLDKQNAWVVVTPDGRFDTNKDLDRVEGVHWVIGNDPFRPLPLELFMRDYYEPRLLRRLLEREALPKVRPLEDLNLAQPGVRIDSVRRGRRANSARVTVEVSASEGTFERGGREVVMRTEAYDLRLFRDGQLVGQWPEPKPGDGGAGGDMNVTAEGLSAWRKSTRIGLRRGARRARHTFDVLLPHASAGRRVQFTAYAFNRDRVKSLTAVKDYPAPPGLAPAPPRAYVISVGVNVYQEDAWNLRFAAGDARLMGEVLGERLRLTKRYGEVVPVTLTTDHGADDRRPPDCRRQGQPATKRNFHSLLNILAGMNRPDAALARCVPGADKLRKAMPGDLVLITFSSHGYTDGRGKFYLVPYDTGRLTPGELGGRVPFRPRVLSRFISSDELMEWTRRVDAGELVMVVDTCHSAGAVEEPGFKPGPMGSRGLGQLAYDKGMRILAASQADDVALEVRSLEHGLLTYALAKEGMEAGRADEDRDGLITLEEWLGYGLRRVPALYEEMRAGRVEDLTLAGRDPLPVTVSGARASLRWRAFQQPSLFDFKRKRNDVILAAARTRPEGVRRMEP